MLTIPEKIILIIALLVTAWSGWRVFIRIFLIVKRGSGKLQWELVPKRLIDVIIKTVVLTPVWKMRLIASFFHALVVWGFVYYLLVNVGDVLQGLFPGFTFLGDGTIGNLYRLGADLLSVSVLVGMVSLLIRRFVFRLKSLSVRENTLLYEKARKSGIAKDSLIVGVFILLHVGGRFFGESFHLAFSGHTDKWQPLASTVSGLWVGMSPNAQEIAFHVCYWFALGLIFLFVPYFLKSKHIHLIFAPINFLTRPERNSIGELDALNFEDESIEQFGVTYLEELSQSQILDAYACIMCNRCQDVCPEYTTGKVLSPSALEINKRYFLNEFGEQLANGETSPKTMLEFAITEEAVFACTACGACTNICPVGNDPMRDILDIRRSLVLMENSFPEQWQNAFRGMERTMNPWNIPATERMKWAEGVEVPTIAENPDPDYLWWVGCAPSTDARAQKTAVAFAKVMNAAGVNYAVLGEDEQCTGDSARRAGNEYLFYEMAMANVELLNEVKPKTIVAACPHCLHTLKNEYGAFGGNYKVIHHSELMEQLINEGELNLKSDAGKVTFHDPCYLGRHNEIIEEPRGVLAGAGANLVEMNRKKDQAFCCGAGGAQMWKEEAEGEERVSENRLEEAKSSGADCLAVACPFCMIMLEDAAGGADDLPIKDIAEIVLEQLVIEE